MYFDCCVHYRTVVMNGICTMILQLYKCMNLYEMSFSSSCFTAFSVHAGIAMGTEIGPGPAAGED